MTPAFVLRGRTALVTGASRGIGAAVALGLARAGANVAVHFNSHREGADAVVSAAREAGATAEAFGCDVTDESAVRALVRAVDGHFGGFDTLVNNAGGLVGRQPPDETDSVFYDRVLDLNIRSVVMLCREAIPVLLRSASAAIINTGSVAGRSGGGPGAALYAGAKAFIHTYTRALAKGLAMHGIRVNAVAPGVIDTDFHATTPPDTMASLAGSVPLGRLGTAEDCVGAYLFLAAPGASGYVTGQIIDINGGMYMP